MSTFKKISLIIVNYNSSEHTSKLLLSTKYINNILEEIIIIDNNSNDLNKLKTKNKKVKIIHNNLNLGFSKAVNQGIKIAKNDFVLLLNPDTILIDNSLNILFKNIKNNHIIGAIGGKIKNMVNKKYQLTATSEPSFLTGIFEFTNFKKLFPNNIFSKNFWIESNNKIIKPIEVKSLCGAFILFRKKLNSKLNLFNESYFLYMEDIDFGLSIIKKGYKVIFDPRSTIKHIGGASSNSKYNTVLKHWYKSRKIFFNQHCNKLQSVILNIVFSIEEKLLDFYHHLKHEPTE